MISHFKLERERGRERETTHFFFCILRSSLRCASRHSLGQVSASLRLCYYVSVTAVWIGISTHYPCAVYNYDKAEKPKPVFSFRPSGSRSLEDGLFVCVSSPDQRRESSSVTSEEDGQA